MWNTVLFDLDGTLTDSGEGITKCVQYALRKEFNIVVDDLRDLDCFVGPPLKEQFMQYAGLTEEEGQRAVRAYRERYRTRGIYENRLYDGILPLLKQLAAEGMTLAVSSSKPTEFCREILRYFGIEPYFRVIVGSELSGERTKKAEVLEETLRRLGMQGSRQCVVLVGDRKYDVEGAKEAGISSIGVTYGYGSRAELEKAWPDAVVDNPEELRNVLIGQYRDGISRSGNPDMPSAVPAGNFPQQPLNPYGYPYGYGPQEYYAPQAYYLPQNPPRMVYVPTPYYPQYAPPRYEPPGAYPQEPAVPRTRHFSSAFPGSAIRSESLVLKVWRILYPVLIEFALSSVVANLAVAAIMVYMGSGGDYLGAYDRNYILIMGITDLLLIPIFAYMMQKDETRRIADGRMDLILRENHINVLQFLLVVIFSICASSVINMLTGWIPTDPSAYEDLQESITSSSVTIQFLVVCITGPFVEEVLFRGVIYRRLRDYTGTAWAAVLSGVIFGFVHMNLLQGVYAALFGVALALLYEHYGTIWASIIAHVANNFYATFGNLALSRLDSFGGSVFSAACIALTFLIGWYIFAYDRKANVV